MFENSVAIELGISPWQQVWKNKRRLHVGSHIRQISSRLFKMIHIVKDFNKAQAASNGVNPYAIDVLRTKRKDLVHGISHTEHLLDLLVTEGVITAMKKSIILKFRTRREQNSRVLELLEVTGEWACRKFFHPCLMLAEPELYHQIKAYVGSVNEYIKDPRRQLIGYLLERDQEMTHEVTKRNVTQKPCLFVSNGAGVTKDITVPPQLDLAQTNPERLHKVVEGKLAEVIHNNNANNSNLSTKAQQHEVAEYGYLSTEELLKKGTRLNLEDSHNLKASHRAATRGSSRTEVVRSLSAGHEQGKTPVSLDTVEGLGEDAERYKRHTQDMSLHKAALEDNWQLVECLLQNGATIDARNDHNKTALFNAVAKSHEKTIATLLNAGAKVDSDVVKEAIKLNHKSVLKILFDKKREAVSEDDLNSALFSAVRQNKDAAVQALIDSGANVNMCDKQRYTPLLLSAELGHTEVFSVLIEKQASLDATLSDRSSVMHLAVQGGSVPIMEKLLERNFNPNSTGPKAQTPLHLAVALNRTDIVCLLLNAGAQVNSTAQDGVTPLHLASQQGNEETVTQLIKEKADLKAVDKLGRTALHWTAAAPGDSHVINVLLSAKINANTLDNEKKSALHLAAMKGNLNIVTSLLSQKARAGAKDTTGSTPLHYAAAAGHGSIVSALLQSLKNTGLEERNTWKKTPLHAAAEKGHRSVVALLLQAGANINSTDQNKDTPLHCAVRGGYLEVVKALTAWGQGSQLGNLKKGNLQATNSVGKTPLQVAEAEKTPEHENVATLLKRKMLLVK